MSERHWARRATYALLTAPSPLIDHQTGGRTRVIDGLTFSALALNGPTFNIVAVTGTPPDRERLETLASEFFGANAPSFGVILEGDDPANAGLQAELSQRGWRIVEEEPAMILSDLQPLERTSVPAMLMVEVVKTPEELDVFFALVLEIFKLTPELLAGLATAPSALDDPRLFFLLGRTAGVPVAIALGAMVEEAVTIYGVGVRSTRRRQGFGTAMTVAAVREGIRRGATLAVLRANPLSQPLYERLGFRVVCLHRTWAFPEPEPATPLKSDGMNG
ncbi:GCN5-related N-acetyltransferase [Isosphaera pallida ATCC 43644]|uniref:GCN5-related N-acetyltransferase n=1 Tax=Isosphaera pallida (strain ATCC 43644 / DSM 9630 / IS1B) TaxID=575540 RepID=E8R4X9_ISOPI|nr:GNAT family N-acetyltransferase [Isosphaera pallida]ADV61725.1 GCN5-related N-acetyltransferase [Isosphaera pallida ATCC 43644]